jgi:hypothetical protein
MAIEIKFCKDCRYYYSSSNPVCLEYNTQIITRDLVSGNSFSKSPTCQTARETTCGFDARYFVGKT